MRTRHGSLLLSVLALRYSRDVERTALAAALWPNHSDDNARAYLRRSLLDLRAALGPEAARILSPSRQTLRLDLSGDARFDVREFDRAIASGSRDDLDRAIALYRGPLLPGLEELNDPDGSLYRDREIRDHQFLDLLERRSTLRGDEHDNGGAIHDLRRLLVLDPLRETAVRGLMKRLVETGDRNAALVEYERLRQRLVLELGVAPEPETRSLFAQLQIERPVSVPSPKLSTDGEGSVPRASIPAMVYGLPVPLTRFFGRESETTLLQQWMLGSPDALQRLITLTGPPGIGKTRLAIEAARSVTAKPDSVRNVWFVAFADVRSTAAARAALGRDLGLTGPKADDIEVIAEVLRGQASPREPGKDARMGLLVLDNLEHLLAEEPAEGESSGAEIALLVHRLLTLVPSLTCLVTSRRPLLLGGEQELRLSSLIFPGDAAPSADDSRGFAAVDLFIDRVRLIRPGFAPNADTIAEIGGLTRLLDGVPLALEMAAAQMRGSDDGLTVTQILAQIAERLNTLSTPQRDLPARQRSLQAAIGWSFSLLSEPEKAVFARLSVFAGGTGLPAAIAVCGVAPVDPDRVADLLARLTAYSLIVANESAGTIRYTMLESLRQFAREKLSERGESIAARARHREWYLALARQGETRVQNGPEQVEWLPRMEREHDNFRAALDAIEGEDASDEERAERLALAAALGPFWYVRSYFTEGRERLRRALASVYDATADAGCSSIAAYVLTTGSADSIATVATALNSMGFLSFSQGDLAAARASLEEALTIYRARGDRRNTMVLAGNLGGLAGALGDFSAGRSFTEEAIAIAREQGNRRGIAGGLTNLGDMAKNQGDFDAAQAYLSEGLAIFREIDEKHGTAMALNNLGEVAMAKEEADKALPHFQEAISLRLAIGDRRGITFSLRGLAEAHLAHADARRAVVLWGAADALASTLNTSLSAGDQARMKCKLETARAVLSAVTATGETEFGSAWNQGRELTWNQAVQYGLE